MDGIVKVDHDHKFFIFQVKADFEPLPVVMAEDADGELVNVNQDLYRRVEYAVSGCSCGEVIKIEVGRRV